MGVGEEGGGGFGGGGDWGGGVGVGEGGGGGQGVDHFPEGCQGEVDVLELFEVLEFDLLGLVDFL